MTPVFDVPTTLVPALGQGLVVAIAFIAVVVIALLGVRAMSEQR